MRADACVMDSGPGTPPPQLRSTWGGNSSRHLVVPTRNISDLLDEREARLADDYSVVHAAHLIKADSSKWVVRCDGWQRLLWDFIVFLLLVYVGLVTPYRLGFDRPATGAAWRFDVAVDFAFCFDVLLTFRTSYVVGATGVEEMAPRRIVSHYLRGWFLIDAVSSVPVELLFASGGEARSLKLSKAGKLLRALRFAKLLRLLRALRMPLFVEAFEERCALTIQQMKGLKLFLCVAAFTHLLTCTWGALRGTPCALPLGDAREAPQSSCVPGWLQRFEVEKLGRAVPTGGLGQYV